MKNKLQYVSLNSICKFESGYTPGSDELDKQGEYPYFKVAEMNIPGNEVYLKYTNLHIQTPQKIYPKGAIVIPKNGGAIFTGKVRILAQDSVIDMNSLAIVPNNLKATKYIYYYIKTLDFHNLVNGSALPTLAMDQMRTLSIPYTNDPIIQATIIEELDALSSIISSKSKQIFLLDKLLVGLYGQLLERNAGNMEETTIGDICTLKSGDSNASKTAPGTLPYVKVSDMNLPGNETSIHYSSMNVDITENSSRIFPIGTVIFPKRGGAILTNKKRLVATEICCDLNTMGVIPGPKVHPLFLYQYFVALDFSKLCNGSSVPQINNCDIAPLEILLPSMKLQKEFASDCDKIQNAKSSIIASNRKVQELLASRMQYWFD